MKLLVLVSLVGACAAGALNSAYLPPAQRAAAGASAAYQQAGAYSQSQGFESARPRAALERNAAILRLDSDVTDQGFHYAFETENGIQAEETAQEHDGVQAQGGYSYTGDDGQVYSVRYAAGAGGFQAEGSHLPTSPPVPEEILKALEENARDEAAGIFDDGSYHEAKYANEGYAQGGAVVAARAQPNAFAQSNAFARQSNAFAHQTKAFSAQGTAFSGQANAFSGQANAFSGQANAFSGKLSAPSREYLTPKAGSAGQTGYRY